MDEIIGEQKATKTRLDPKCWTGKKIGNPATKVKGGVRVNNCVPAESVEEDLSRRGFMQGLGMAAAGAAGLGAAGAAQARTTPEWTSKVERAKTLMAKGQSREQTARIMGIKGPNPGGTGPMSGDWGAVNYAAQEMRVKESVAEEYNAEYDDEAAPHPQELEMDAKVRSMQIQNRADDAEQRMAARNNQPKNIVQKIKKDIGGPLAKLAKGDIKGALGENDQFNGEYDDEAGMADNNIETMKRAVDGLDGLIHQGDNLPEWCQEKIAVAKSMLVTVWDYMASEEGNEDPDIAEMYEAMELFAEEVAINTRTSVDAVWETFEAMDDNTLFETAAWRRSAGKSKKGGLNAKGVASYRRENPGSKLQMAVTTKPSKLKKGSKAAKRRKSFCARMGGVKGPMKKPNGKPTRKALALRKWNC